MLFEIFFVILHAEMIDKSPLRMNKSLFYEQLYAWYRQYHRVLPWRETTDPYRIWLSEIILQQTRVVQGMEYYLRMVERFPSVDELAKADESEVLLYWQGLGYYSRARNLYKGAQMLAGKPFPTTFEGLRKIPGVGDYTAGAIASFAYDLPYPALDGNVYRVLSRLYDIDIPFDTTQGKKHFHAVAEDLLDTHHPRLFNSAIMEFGALYCLPQSPDCTHCPLATFCQANMHHTADLLPIRKARPAVRDRYLKYTIYVESAQDSANRSDMLRCRTLIHRREGKDIWQHLWEFPVQESNQPFAYKPHTLTFTHVLSHQRIHAGFEIRMVTHLPQQQGETAVTFSDLQNYALSRLTLRALEHIIGK